MRYFIELSYKGTNYHGWQIQPNALTIQEILQKALSALLKNETEIIGAGRTDTGVHASYYIAHFDSDSEIDINKTAYSLNKMVPYDIAINRIFQVKDEAHSRFSAISRTYKYYITLKKNPFTLETQTYIWGKLDVDLMNKACEILFQHIDFTSFSKLHTDTVTNNCSIIQAYWENGNNELIFTIKADRFLRNMVRAVVGTMLEVGRGKITLSDFNSIITSKNRSNAGVSAPAQGLFLYDIEYPSTIYI